MANLTLFPPWSGDKAPYDKYLAPINDEMWARSSIARKRILDETGVRHIVNSGFRPPGDQNYFWNCYQCCCCNNCNLAARPGSSPHELGMAIDFSGNPRNVRRSNEIFYECGINFPIYGSKPEPWHGQMYNGRPSLNIPSAPAEVVLPKKETAMSLSNSHCINGVTLEAEIFTFPTLVRIRWNTPDKPLWPANGYVSMVNYLPHSPGPTPHWVNHIEVGEVAGQKGPRFVIVAKDTNTHLATAAYQAEGNQGSGIIQFDLNSKNSGHPGWWPAG